MEQLIRDDRRVSIALMAPSVALAFQHFVLYSFNLFGTPLGATVQLIFGYAAPVVWKRNKTRFLAVYFAGLSVFTFHYLVFPGNRPDMNGLAFSLFFMCLPALVYGSSIRDWAVLKVVMRGASLFIFFIGMTLAILAFFDQIGMFYSMSLSYLMLLPAITFGNDCYTKD